VCLVRQLDVATAIRRSLAVLIGVAGLALAARYLHGGSWWVLFVFVAAGSLCARFHLWCWALPVALVVGDLYPWTGNLLVNERDLFLTGTLAVLLWRTKDGGSLMRQHKWLAILWLPWVASISVSFLRAWQDLEPLAFGDDLGLYGSHWNAARVAKGFVWGLLIAPFWYAEMARNPNRFQTFAKGMQVSALIVAAAVIYERAISVGVFDLQQLYRASGPFFSMHTGGQHIDAFWAMALPFLFLPLNQRQTWPRAIIRMIILIVSYYAIAATMSRAIIVWTGCATIALLLQHMLAGATRPTRRQAAVVAVLAFVMLAAGAAAVLSSDPIRTRFTESRKDLRIRWHEWKALAAAADRGWMARVFGNGLGAVPSIASTAYGHPLRPAELIALDNERTALRIRPGKAVYVEQLVDRNARGPWTLHGRVRHIGSASLHSHVCAKTLFDSFHCIESEYRPQRRGNDWQPFVWTIDIGRLPSAVKNTWLNCPVTIAFSAGKSGSVDIAALRLIDAAGFDLLKNSDFHARTAHWFFTSDDHSSWRAENLWVHLFLEQGMLGAVSFAWLVLGTATLLVWTLAASRDISLGVLLIAIAGFLAIGMFGSLLDTPWIAQLLCTLLAVSQARIAGWQQAPNGLRSAAIA
jgi:hypothetical protein